jgi:CRISPR-associated protein Cas2
MNSIYRFRRFPWTDDVAESGDSADEPKGWRHSSALSSYRVMWIFVLFDLPVGTKKERKAATKFRHSLLDLGFEMSQFSVYLKFCAGKEQAEAIARQVEAAIPNAGKVHLVAITDKQYENIRTYRGRKREPATKMPDQLALF